MNKKDSWKRPIRPKPYMAERCPLPQNPPVIDALFHDANPDSLSLLMKAIDLSFPLQQRHRAELPKNVYALSRSLTAEKERRDEGYLGRPEVLSAYVHYFLPWNVYRLSRLLPALRINPKTDGVLLDLGSGPLTFPIALWLSRPDLRALPLELRCLDRNAKALEAGSRLFETLLALSGESASPWRLKTIRAPLGARIEGEKASLVVAANLLNELFWNERERLASQAAKKAALFSALTDASGSILLIEPGVPRSSELLAALRTAFLESGHSPLAPCPTAGPCPMPGGRGAKWCHFACDADGAPERLRSLSEAAGLPKDRVVLSFLHMGPLADKVAAVPEGLGLRIVSDAFPLPLGGVGRYACSARGLVLVRGPMGLIGAYPSGSFIFAPPGAILEERDQKSGALVVQLGAVNQRPRPAALKRR